MNHDEWRKSSRIRFLICFPPRSRLLLRIYFAARRGLCHWVLLSCSPPEKCLWWVWQQANLLVASPSSSILAPQSTIIMEDTPMMSQIDYKHQMDQQINNNKPSKMMNNTYAMWRRKLLRRRKANTTRLLPSSNPFHLFLLLLALFFPLLNYGLDKSELLCCSRSMYLLREAIFSFFSRISCVDFFLASSPRCFLHDFLVPGAPYNNVCEACFVLSFFSETRDFSVFGLVARGLCVSIWEIKKTFFRKSVGRWKKPRRAQKATEGWCRFLFFSQPHQNDDRSGWDGQKPLCRNLSIGMAWLVYNTTTLCWRTLHKANPLERNIIIRDGFVLIDSRDSNVNFLTFLALRWIFSVQLFCRDAWMTNKCKWELTEKCQKCQRNPMHLVCLLF